MEKILFTIKPHSIIDVITNSSSELFIGKTQNKNEIIELIKKVHPYYLGEYEELKSIDELSLRELNTYIEHSCNPSIWPTNNKLQYPLLNGFTFDELYVKVKTAWNGHDQYELKSYDGSKYGSFVVDENFEEIKNKLDPNREMYFLFSIDDSPDFDMQEKLANFMERYHLG